MIIFLKNYLQQKNNSVMRTFLSGKRTTGTFDALEK